jgi:fructan beta-fructosidase
MRIARLLLISGMALVTTAGLAQSFPNLDAQYRPQIHFTPRGHWMNDPNGLVYANNTYHLFFQYYPDATVWGPMHWGHATSKDLYHWEEQPIALYPDSLGYIFSGSAVYDVHNTSGFGVNGKAPLVAIFTYHNPMLEAAKSDRFQYQGLAYSLDDGRSWTKYSANPVLANPGITDFRDPKVIWYAPEKKWVMSLATKDRITFFASKDLKSWEKLSEFGQQLGAHGGVWECPDLIEFDYMGKKAWVLFVSINPGGPQGGSATQYFVGNFDGLQFTPTDTATRWIDEGADNYAGVTYFNTPGRKIFLGWMSNWNYANSVPTTAWRSANTIPRELYLVNVKGRPYLASRPAKELTLIKGKSVTVQALRHKEQAINGPFQLELQWPANQDGSIRIGNVDGEEIRIGFEKSSNRFYIDRTKSGQTGFREGFAARHYSSRIAASPTISVNLIVDKMSVELFADDGLTVMTDIMFPLKPYTSLTINTSGTKPVTMYRFTPLKPSMLAD